MSPKRCLLIAVALWAVVSWAQVSGWTYSNVYNFTNANKDQLTGLDLNKVVSVQLGKSVLELENRLVYTDRMQEERQDRINDRIQISLSSHSKTMQAKAFYRGEFFDKNLGRSFWDNDIAVYAKHTYNQQIGGYLSFDQDAVYGTVAARQRTFFYNPMNDGEAKYPQAANVNTSFTAGYRIIKPLSVFTTGYVKQALDKKSDAYNVASGGVGMALNMPLFFVGNLAASSKVEWLKGEQLSTDLDTLVWMDVQNTQRLMPVISELRYTHMITPSLTSFISYYNRAFYDKNAGQMLLNSDMLRMQVKYTLGYDLSAGTFVEVGTKLSPEDRIEQKNSVTFAKAEFQTLPRLYLGGGYSAMPDRLNRYEGVVRYYLSSWNEVFFNYIMYDDNYSEDDPYDNSGVQISGDTKYAGVGIRMMF